MAPWEDAWLNGKLMPPHGLPKLLLIEAQAIAEEWLIEENFRCMLEEWVSQERAEEVVSEILWSGRRLHGEFKKRVPPIPVLVRLMHSEPFPNNIVELEDRMIEYRKIAIREWIKQYQKYGDDVEGAP
jgi:hypothetical protein